MKDLQSIAQLGTEIQETKSEDSPVRVVATLGELQFEFTGFSLSLDNGRSIDLEKLWTASETYWNRWQDGIGAINE